MRIETRKKIYNTILAKITKSHRKPKNSYSHETNKNHTRIDLIKPKSHETEKIPYSRKNSKNPTFEILKI